MWDDIEKHKLISIFGALSLTFVLGGLLWAYFALRGITNTPLILHFNTSDGITQVGGLGTLVFWGLFGIVACIMNSFVALEFDRRNHLFGKFLASLTLMFAALLFIAFATIINANV